MAERQSESSKGRKRRTTAASAGSATDGEAPRHPGLLSTAEQFWLAAADRLRLSAAAKDVGSVLLRAELDPEARSRLMAGEAVTTAVRRARLMSALESPSVAASGLVELERRGVVVQISAGDWLSAEVALDPRVRAACIAGPLQAAPASVGLDESAFPLRVREQMSGVFEMLASAPRRHFVVLRGRGGSGRDTLAAMMAERAGTALAPRTPEDLRGATDILEPELSGAVPLWDAAGLDPSPDDLRRAASWLARSGTVAIAIIDRHQDAPDVPGRDLVLVEPDPLDAAERTEVWTRVLQEVEAPSPTAARLARRNRAAAGLAARAARPLDRGERGSEQVIAGIEQRLAALARPSSLRGIVVEHPDVALSRVIVQPHIAAGISRLVALARSAPEDTNRRGVKVMFAGASGTGKTLAARAIATELALPLFRVDLATVVSKWVGETEKNLRHAMDAAQSAGAVLLFDEGDALFSKRGEVQRGTDRYANMEASYLLQAFEAHDGVAIVTTNLVQNIDTAFVRRFDACVHFQRPTPPLRAALWRQELGPAAGDVSEQFILRVLCPADIPGGNIAGAARLARALAAHRGAETVSEEDLKTAVGAEFEKMGATVEAQRWYSPGKSDARPS